MQAEVDWRLHGSSLLSLQQHATMLQRSWQTAASLPTPTEPRCWMSRILTWTGVPPFPHLQPLNNLCAHAHIARSLLWILLDSVWVHWHG